MGNEKGKKATALVEFLEGCKAEGIEMDADGKVQKFVLCAGSRADVIKLEKEVGVILAGEGRVMVNGIIQFKQGGVDETDKFWANIEIV